jgi:peptidoglycan-associated lipoprotein
LFGLLHQSYEECSMTYTRFSFLALSLCIVLFVSGCARRAPAPAPPPPAPAAPPTTPAAPPPPPEAPAAPAPAPLTEEELFERMTLEELNKKRPLGDVFFAFDSSELNQESRGALQKNAEWMKRWGSTRVTVEGHCDSRGTAEYNIALGNRRANATREYLVSLGVAGDRVTAISKGKEQPFCTEEHEGCWSQNRRGHFIITAK